MRRAKCPHVRRARLLVALAAQSCAVLVLQLAALRWAAGSATRVRVAAAGRPPPSWQVVQRGVLRGSDHAPGDPRRVGSGASGAPAAPLQGASEQALRAGCAREHSSTAGTSGGSSGSGPGRTLRVVTLQFPLVGRGCRRALTAHVSLINRTSCRPYWEVITSRL